VCKNCDRYKSIVKLDQSLIKLSILKEFVMSHMNVDSKKDPRIGQMEVTEIAIDNEFVFALNNSN